MVRVEDKGTKIVVVRDGENIRLYDKTGLEVRAEVQPDNEDGIISLFDADENLLEELGTFNDIDFPVGNSTLETVNLIFDILQDEEGLGGTVVVVNNPSIDLPKAVDGVITLAASTVYRINGFFTISDRFVLGEETQLEAVNGRVHGFNYTGTANLFTALNVSYNIMGLKLSASTGTLFDNVNSFENKQSKIISNLLEDVNSIGKVEGFEVCIFEFNRQIDCGQGLLLKGPAHIFYIGNKAYDWKQQASSKMLLLEETVGDTIVSNNLFHPETNETGFEVDVAATISSLVVSSNAFVGESEGGTLLGSAILADTENTAYTFIANSGIQEFSDVVAGIELSTTATASTNVLAGSYVLVAGTTAATNAFRFIQSANMTIQSKTANDADFNILAEVVAQKDAGADKEYDFALFKNGTIISESEVTNVTLNSLGGTSFQLMTKETLSPDDTIDVRVSGNGTADDITAEVKIIV